MTEKKEVFNIPDYEGCGIYAIINLHDMRCYIGASKRIKYRASQHRSDLKSGKHANKLLQEDFSNGTKLDFIIIYKPDKNISKDDFIALEKLYMLTAIEEGFEIYNMIPKTNWRKQTDWINIHLVNYLMNKHKTRKNFIDSFSFEFGTTPGYMKNRRPENR